MIYKVSNKELKKVLVSFGRTTYGKIMFITCYMPFFISFLGLLLTIFVYFSTFHDNNFIMGLIILIATFIAITSFSIGTYAYYKELRIYLKTK